MYLLYTKRFPYHMSISPFNTSRALPHRASHRWASGQARSSCSAVLSSCTANHVLRQAESHFRRVPTHIRVGSGRLWWLMDPLAWVDGLFVAERKLFQHISSRQRNMICFINKLLFDIVRVAFIWKLWIESLWARCRWRGCCVTKHRKHHERVSLQYSITDISLFGALKLAKDYLW